MQFKNSGCASSSWLSMESFVLVLREREDTVDFSFFDLARDLLLRPVLPVLAVLAVFDLLFAL